MAFNKLCYMLVISDRPPSGPTMLYWHPFLKEPKTLRDIINTYNNDCFEKYRKTPGWEDELKIMKYAIGIGIIPNLSEVRTLEEYKKIFFLMVDVDTIQDKLKDIEDIQERKIESGYTKCRLIQVSNQSNADSCTKYFKYLAFGPKDDRVIKNMKDLLDVLDGVCSNSHCYDVTYYSTPLSGNDRISEKHLQEIGDKTLKEAIMADLSKEETIKLAKSTYSTITREFASKPIDKKTKYFKLRYTQDPEKAEMAEYRAKIKKKQGLHVYDPGLFIVRKSIPYTISGTKILCDVDDLHFVNNAAMQQEWDDIRRTCIVGLDLAHETLEKRLGKEVTPETINYYLEVLNHAMPGAAIVQEHMVETHPALVDDCYVKVFTGDEILQDEIDSQFVINIDKEFPAKQSKQIKVSVGNTTWQSVHIPTIVTRTEDGAGTSRWMAMQIGMTFISAYHMCAGEAAVGELAFTAKHGSLVEMGDMLPARRVRGPNEPGGLSFGHMCDIVQTGRKTPDDPCNIVLQVGSAATMLYDQIWFGGYMSSGGLTQFAIPAYTNDILDDYVYFGADYAQNKYGHLGKVKATIETIKDISTEITLYGIESYELNKTTLENHFCGSQRATSIAVAAGSATAMATGYSNAGLSAWYLSMYLHKEAWGRLGFHGYDQQDQCGAANSFSIGSDEGCIGELRGPNYPDYAMAPGHIGGYTVLVSAAHAGRKDAFCLNPLIKSCFADELINFDFADPRREFAKGALREWDRTAGERSFVIPAK